MLCRRVTARLQLLEALRIWLVLYIYPVKSSVCDQSGPKIGGPDLNVDIIPFIQIIIIHVFKTIFTCCTNPNCVSLGQMCLKPNKND